DAPGLVSALLAPENEPESLETRSNHEAESCGGACRRRDRLGGRLLEVPAGAGQHDGGPQGDARGGRAPGVPRQREGVRGPARGRAGPSDPAAPPFSTRPPFSILRREQPWP